MSNLFDFHPNDFELNELGITNKKEYLKSTSEDDQYFDMARFFALTGNTAIRYMYHQFTETQKALLDEGIRETGLNMIPTKAEKDETIRVFDTLTKRLEQGDNYGIVHTTIMHSTVMFFGFDSDEHQEVYQFKFSQRQARKHGSKINKNKSRRQRLIDYMPELIKRVEQYMG